MSASLVRRVFVPSTSKICSRIVGCRSAQFSSSSNTKDSDDKQEAISPISDDAAASALSKFAKLVDKVEKQNQVKAALEREREALERQEKQRIEAQKAAQKAVERDLALFQSEGQEAPAVQESFASMFRKSKLVSLGEYDGRLLQGNIIEVMDDDLYIDFGAKFHCVCRRPAKDSEKYIRGEKVLIQLREVEMSSAFLGSDRHVTLLEGDAILRGLINKRRKTETSSIKPRTTTGPSNDVRANAEV